jgi:protein-S-isoprenylcysteine O-methyltransferase Ste14
MKTKKDVIFVWVLTVLCIACFPMNPLVLTGALDVKTYLATSIPGWIAWAFGMGLVLAPILLFPKRGGVPKGKSFVRTTRLVDTGIYAIIRHPQYTGGVYSIFVANFLFYPHWLFAVMGIAGAYLCYWSVKTEDRLLVEKFGEEYSEYMKRVPGMNFVAGTLRALRRRKNR